MASDFRLLDAARSVVDEVNDIVSHSRRRLLDERQLSEAAGSITANIREAYGRRAGAERNQFFRFARGSAEETDEHLRANFAAKRVDPKRYWRIHNRLIVIRKMLTGLLNQRR